MGRADYHAAQMDRLGTLLVMAAFGAILLACEWIGFRRWVRPIQPPPSTAAKAMAGLVILTMTGGFIGGIAWWLGVSGSFAWALPPLAGRMLGAASWAFAVACLLCLGRPAHPRVRLVLLMIAVYLGPLAVAAILFHLDRFDLMQPISWGFFAVVIAFVALALLFLARQPTLLPDGPINSTPSGRDLRIWLLATALLAGVWAVALYATNSGLSDTIWVWPGDLLTSRLIGSMLLTIAVVGAWASRREDAGRVVLLVDITYGGLVVLAGLASAVSGKPIPVAYVAAFGGLAIGSAYVLLAQSRQGTQAARLKSP